MWECESCHRHVLLVSPICPFCAHRRISALGLAIATPVLLSACYGLPPCQPKDLVDADGDGFPAEASCATTATFDCDDSDPAVNPDATEVCGNDVDENCDGIVAGTSQAEVCGNGLDDDCDGQVDEADCVGTGTPTTPASTGSTGDTATSGSTGSSRRSALFRWWSPVGSSPATGRSPTW